MYIIIDNYDSFTYNIFQLLSTLTHKEIQVIRNDSVDSKILQDINPEGIIISPGPGRPENAGACIDIIRTMAGKIPILGICLGHQAIVKALGGNIILAKHILHGKTDTIHHDGQGLFYNATNPLNIVRYHSLVAEEATLPACLKITARSRDNEIMAVRHKKMAVEGVQFHPESFAGEEGKVLLQNFIKKRTTQPTMKSLLQEVITKKDLTQDKAQLFMEEMTSGTLHTAFIAAFVTALESKGISPYELTGFAAVMLKKCVSLDMDKELLDIVGTGGDGVGTFNISSMAAITAASCGIPVAKHGNRAVSSSSGSSDFYESLGIPVNITPEKACEVLKKHDFTFLFAPTYHHAMGFAAPARKALGLKTCFNLLGPLLNPARANYQLIGVYDKSLCKLMACTSKSLGIKRVMVIHARDGIDEFSIAAPTDWVFIDEKNTMTQGTFFPEDLGITGYTLEDIIGSTPDANSRIAMDMLQKKAHPAILEAVALNAGAALFVCHKALSVEKGYELAKEALTSGKTLAKVKALQKEIQEAAA